MKAVFPFIFVLFLLFLPAGAVYSQQSVEAPGKESPSQPLFSISTEAMVSRMR